MIRVSGFIALLAVSALAIAVLWLHGTTAIAIVPALLSDALRLDFAATPLASPFLVLIAIVAPGIGLWNLSRGNDRDGFSLAGFALAMILVLLAQSVAAFILSWEIMSLVSTFLVATLHDRRYVRRAVFSYVIISQLGVMCLTAALAMLAMNAGSYRFETIAHFAGTIPALLRSVIFALALIGFGSKAGLIPLQFWLPRAHPAAPAAASAFLSGVMLKIAIYGLLLLGLQLASPVPLSWGIATLALGLISAVGGALYASVETDIKRLLAYSSIENIGIIVSGIGLVFVANVLGLHLLAELALLALLFAVLNHGLFKSLLFLSAGTIAQTARTTDMEHLGGLLRLLPATGVAMLVGCMAASALPPLNGFVSEWLLFMSFIHALIAAPMIVQILAACALAALALSGGLALAAYSKLFGIAMLGQRRDAREPQLLAHDRSWLGLVWLGTGCIALGLIPALAVASLQAVAESTLGTRELLSIPLPPSALALLPVLGVVAAIILLRVRGIRRVPTWTCGSPVTVRAQATASSFGNPLLTIFAPLLQAQRSTELCPPTWFPSRIVAKTQLRFRIDDVARNIAARIQNIARAMRIIQGGRLRVYLAYALVAVLVMLVIAR